MLNLLLKNRLKIIFLGFTRGEPKKRAARIIGAVIAVTIFSIVLYYSSKIISFVYNRLDIKLADTIFDIALDYALAIVFIFILFTGIAASLYILYLSKDLELLLSLPISYRVVFTYKYIEALISNSYLFFIIVFPFLIAYGITSQMPVIYYPVMLMVFISIISIPTGLGILIGMIAARYINPVRSREMLAVIGGLLGLIIWLSSQIIPRYIKNITPDISAMETESMQQYITDAFSRPFLKVLPSTAGSNALFFLHNGDYEKFILNFVFITSISVLLIFLCIALSQRLYYTGWSSASQVISRRGTGKSKKDKSGKIVKRKYKFSIFSGINYMIVKDFKVLARDVRKLTQLIMPLVMLIFIFFWSFSGETGEFKFFTEIETLLFLLFPLLVTGMVNTNLSGNNIGGEGLKFWILKTSPVRSEEILRTKIIYSSCITTLIGFMIMLIFYFIYKPGVITLIAGFLLLMLFSWGDSTICTSIGTFFPVFRTRQSGRNNISSLGGILILIFFIAYLIIFAGTVVGMLFVADYLKWQNIAVFTVIIIIETLLNLFLYYILIKIGARRLNSLEWKY